jgi:predicted ribosomally synthesized peptide with nif11-like leader
MSKQDAEKFIKQIQSDDDLRTKVNESRDSIVKVAKEKGFDVSTKELRQALMENWKNVPDGVDEDHVPFSEAPCF